MNSTLPVITSLILSICAIILAGYSLFKSATSASLKKLFSSEPEPETLQQILLKIANRVEGLGEQQNRHQQDLAQLGNILNTAIRHVSIVRFDSGSSDGGNLSFSLALLDGSQTGIVITSLHGREHNRVYVKPITQGASANVLSSEETEAIMQALTGAIPAPEAPKKRSRKTQS